MVERVIKSSNIVVPHDLTTRGRLAAALISGCIRSVAATTRFQVEDRSGLLGGSGEQAIFCAWHNRLALSLVIYRRFIRGTAAGHRRLAALVSASKDGGLLAGVLQRFGAQPVRGSSSRRGSQALLELTTWAERGYDIAITPDGPRGPRYVVQDGVVALAQLTGLPVVPISYFMGPKITLKSWDRFQIPMPFGRCEIQVGQPLRVPRSASDRERAAFRAELEEQLKSLTRD